MLNNNLPQIHKFQIITHKFTNKLRVYSNFYLICVFLYLLVAAMLCYETHIHNLYPKRVDISLTVSITDNISVLFFSHFLLSGILVIFTGGNSIAISLIPPL